MSQKDSEVVMLDGNIPREVMTEFPQKNIKVADVEDDG